MLHLCIMLVRPIDATRPSMDLPPLNIGAIASKRRHGLGVAYQTPRLGRWRADTASAGNHIG